MRNDDRQARLVRCRNAGSQLRRQLIHHTADHDDLQRAVGAMQRCRAHRAAYMHLPVWFPIGLYRDEPLIVQADVQVAIGSPQWDGGNIAPRVVTPLHMPVGVERCQRAVAPAQVECASGARQWRPADQRAVGVQRRRFDSIDDVALPDDPPAQRIQAGQISVSVANQQARPYQRRGACDPVSDRRVPAYRAGGGE
jgi:hypothetical protein